MNDIVINGYVQNEVQENVGDDGELRLVRFTLRRSRRKGEEWESEYYTVVCFPPLAEAVKAYLRHKDPILVVGRLGQYVIRTEDGEMRKTNIIASDVFISVRHWSSFEGEMEPEENVEEE